MGRSVPAMSRLDEVDCCVGADNVKLHRARRKLVRGATRR